MNEQTARRIVYERSRGICEVCSSSRATDYQHRKNRSQLGRWHPSNAIHACHLCHMRMHSEPLEAQRNGWTVLSYDDPCKVQAYLKIWCGTGWFWLDELGGYEFAPERV